MGLFDDLKAAADSHEDQIEQAVDKTGDFVDDKTGNKYAGQVDQAQEFLKDRVGQPEPRPEG